MTAMLAWLVALAGCGPAGPAVYPENLADWRMLEVTTGSGGERSLVLADDVLPYELATPLFSDYARKLRTIRLPEGESATYRPDGPFDFPEGTVISKTFYYPRGDGLLRLTADSRPDYGDGSLDLSRVELIETRLLVREAGGWEALPYVWNEEQNRATLRIQGDIRGLRGMDDTGQLREFTYLVPNRNECGSCHITDERTGMLQPIGPAARHLNRPSARPGSSPAGQLQTWADHGMLRGLPEDDTQIPAAPVWDPDGTSGIEDRARAWLDINCGHCHRPNGAADNSGLFLHAAETSMVRLGRCKPPVAAGRGTGGNRFSLQPGAPEQSILYHRINSTEPDIMMPELGRSLVQQESLALIRRWISEMPGNCQ